MNAISPIPFLSGRKSKEFNKQNPKSSLHKICIPQMFNLVHEDLVRVRHRDQSIAQGSPLGSSIFPIPLRRSAATMTPLALTGKRALLQLARVVPEYLRVGLQGVSKAASFHTKVPHRCRRSRRRGKIPPWLVQRSASRHDPKERWVIPRP